MTKSDLRSSLKSSGLIKLFCNWCKLTLKTVDQPANLCMLRNLVTFLKKSTGRLAWQPSTDGEDLQVGKEVYGIRELNVTTPLRPAYCPTCISPLLNVCATLVCTMGERVEKIHKPVLTLFNVALVSRMCHIIRRRSYCDRLAIDGNATSVGNIFPLKH